MDRRQKRTRNAIFSAFSELLSQKSFSKITVQDIIDAADVGRTTFYAHFETKDDLVREMCAEIFDHVIYDGIKAENCHYYSISNGAPQDIIPHILFHVRSNQKNIIGILSCESGELFLRYFKQYISEVFSNWIVETPEAQEKQVPRDFLIDHVSSSFVNTVQWWIKNRMMQSPEELTSYFLAVIGSMISFRQN